MYFIAVLTLNMERTPIKMVENTLLPQNFEKFSLSTI